MGGSALLKTRSLANTGTCGCCGRNIKLGFQVGEGKIGFHGFRRPQGWQTTMGACPGVGNDPIEVSPEALQKLAAAMTRNREELKAELEGYSSGAKTRIALVPRRPGPMRIVNLGDVNWDWELRKLTTGLAQKIAAHDRDIAALHAQIAAWKSAPLPG